AESAADGLTQPLRVRQHRANRFLKIVAGGPGELLQGFVRAGELQGTLLHPFFQLHIDLLDTRFGGYLASGVASSGSYEFRFGRMEGTQRNSGGERRAIRANGV